MSTSMVAFLPQHLAGSMVFTKRSAFTRWKLRERNQHKGVNGNRKHAERGGKDALASDNEVLAQVQGIQEQAHVVFHRHGWILLQLPLQHLELAPRVPVGRLLEGVGLLAGRGSPEGESQGLGVLFGIVEAQDHRVRLHGAQPRSLCDTERARTETIS